MNRSIFFLALMGGILWGHSASAAMIADPWPPWSIPQDFDLGNITSDGSGGRQTLVRPLTESDKGENWRFFPPHDQLPDVFPDPTPATPAQADVHLMAGTPLVLVLPQLQHFPLGAEVAVAHTMSGQEITVDASIHYLGSSTDTIYGPHEYLYRLGTLDAGQYRLTLNVARSAELGTASPALTTGYVDFVVHHAPEPSALALACIGAALLGSSRRGLCAGCC